MSWPKSAEAERELGMDLFGQGRLDEAICAFRRAIEIRQDYVEAHSDLARTLARSGRHVEAVSAFERLLELHSGFPDAYHEYGLALAELGQHNEAVDAYRRAIRLSPQMAVYHYTLGNSLVRSGKPADAITAYEQAIRLDPKFADAFANLGTTQGALGLWAQAVASYRRLLYLRPDPEAFLSLGVALLESGHPEEAERVFREGLTVGPRSIELLCRIGGVCGELGKYDAAVEALTAALRLDPKNTWVRTTLVTALLGLDQTAEAERLCREGLATMPGAADLHCSLGAVHMRRGDANLALESFESALTADPEYLEARGGRAVALQQLGRPKEALEDFAAVLARAPEYFLQYPEIKPVYEAALKG